jgi:hypothetical protein
VELCNLSPANLDARGGFDADPDLTSPNINNGDLDSGFDENAFADFAIEYKHWFLPDFHRDCKLPIDLNLSRFERAGGPKSGQPLCLAHRWRSSIRRLARHQATSTTPPAIQYSRSCRETLAKILEFDVPASSL